MCYELCGIVSIESTYLHLEVANIKVTYKAVNK